MAVDQEELEELIVDMSDEEISNLVSSLPAGAVDGLLEGLRRPKQQSSAAKYLYDPVGFSTECIDWRGDQLAPYQAATMEMLPKEKRVAVRGPHGLGKTAEAAIIIWWFAVTREAAGIDWKVVTTASVWRQLSKYLWPEVHKWAKRIRWDVVGREPLTSDRELLTMEIKLQHGQAFAVASNDEEKIEGAHADHILYLIDEAKAVPAATWDAIEGALSADGVDTAQEAYAVAISTPGATSNRFHAIATGKPGYEDWTARHVTLDDAVAAGRISRDWAEQRKRQWGETSALYLNRVLGEFADTSTDSVIPLPWIEAAQERWHETQDPGPLTHVGVDVARFGDDDTVVALRHGDYVHPLEARHGMTTTEITDTAFTLAEEDTSVSYVVDVVGLGAGVVDQLRDRKKCRSVVAFSAGEGTKQTDRSGEVSFANKRSAAWWLMREALDPSFHPTVALPPDDDLASELSTPTWWEAGKGRIQVETKKDIRKRLGRSTDRADAVLQAFFEDGSGQITMHRQKNYRGPRRNSIAARRIRR